MKELKEKNLLAVLKKTGLDESEATVYLSALKLGKANIRQLAKEAELNRTSVYSIVERLKVKGLISQIKYKGKILLNSISPEKLLKIQKENYEDLEKHIKDLKYLFTIAQKEPGVRFYEGKEGLKSVLNAIIEEAKEIDIFGDGNAFKKKYTRLDRYLSRKKGAKEN